MSVYFVRKKKMYIFAPLIHAIIIHYFKIKNL